MTSRPHSRTTPRSPVATLLRALRALRRRVLLHRRPLAALTAGGAVLAGVQVVSPPPPPTVAVWAAAHDLPGGQPLTATDLAPTVLPPAAVPAGAVRSREQLLGRVLAAPLARGEVLTGTRTLGAGLLAAYPGRTAVPVRVADGEVVALLRVGDRVTLVAGDPEGRAAPTTLARDVAVVALPRPSRGALAPGQTGRLAVLAVPTAAAEEVAARALGGFLTVVWSR